MNTEYSVRLNVDDRRTELLSSTSFDAAAAAAKANAIYGYRVFDEKNRMVYCPYRPLQSDILREAKIVTDYVRENEFKYGDAPINPAMNHDAKLVSCDRLVDWVLYRIGYTDQVERQGMVVSHATEPERDLASWCAARGFPRIEDISLLEPADIVFSKPHTSAAGRIYPGHTFLFAGFAADNELNATEINHPDGHPGELCSYRYDCGMDKRIQSVQPFFEPLNEFMFAYRPIDRPIDRPIERCGGAKK